MISKLFNILDGVKRTSHITEASRSEMIGKIVNEVSSGSINAVEAYAMLDNLKRITDEAMKGIKDATLETIKQEGENQAFNIQLGLFSKKEYNYSEDKEWAEINRKQQPFVDAKKAREEYLKQLVTECINLDKTPPISYTSSIIIQPKPISNT